MRAGRREYKNQNIQKLNVFKVLIAIILVVTVISGIIYLIKYANKDTKLKEQKEVLESSLEKNEVTVKTIEDIAKEFGGEVKEKVKSDTYYVVKEDKEYTIYDDGEIVEGRVVMWDGSSQKPAIDEAGNVNIYNPAELRWVAEQVASGEKSFAGVTITLRNSLDFGARKNDQDVWEGAEWTPIIGFLEPKSEETQTEQVPENAEVTQEYLKRFAGTFIGNGCSIRGLYVNSENKYSGLFGYQTGVITGLNIKNSFISGKDSVGAIVGLNAGTIQNCSIQNVEVIGKEKIGGLVGTTMTSSVIEDCKSEGNKNLIVGDKYVGGIVRIYK